MRAAWSAQFVVYEAGPRRRCPARACGRITASDRSRRMRAMPLDSSAAANRRIVRAACPHDCPDTCAMLVTVEDGRAVDIRGDPEHPFTRGGLCVKDNNYERRVYS